VDQGIGSPVSTARPLLACRGVTKFFGALAAVSELSFELVAGEVLGIGGPNGAGKTTLFDVVSGFSRASAGAITFDGEDITAWPPNRICHKGIARTFQVNAGFDTLTVRENVLVAAYFGAVDRAVPGLHFSRGALEDAEEVLRQVGMADKRHQIVRHLPVLDRKLLMIASALATRPKLLLMDEPVGGLNPEETDLITRLVGELPKLGLTLIIIEHVMRFLVALSNRVMILHHGEKIYEGSPQGMVRDRTVVDVYLGEGTSARLAHLLSAKNALNAQSAAHS
jgi:branched-chain amino acid transport system ATP-binding protein